METLARLLLASLLLAGALVLALLLATRAIKQELRRALPALTPHVADGKRS